MTDRFYKQWLMRAAFWGGAALALFFVFRYLLPWLLPFWIGLVCAVVLQKPLSFLVKHTPFGKGVWVLVLVGWLAVAVFGGLAYSTYTVYDRLFLLVNKAAELIPLFKDSVSSLLSRFSTCTQKLPPSLLERLQTTPGELAGLAIDYASRGLTDLAAKWMVHLPALLLTTVVSVAACFYLTADYPRLANGMMKRCSPKWQKLLQQTKQIVTTKVARMLKGYLLLTGITFIELFFGFLILRIPYASTLALLVAVVDLLPVLGTGTVLLPWGGIALFLGNTKMGTGIFVLYLLITAVRQLIEPKIIGKQVGLPPLVMLLTMYVGLKLFGFWGLWGLPLFTIVAAGLAQSGLLFSSKSKDALQG